MDAPLVITKFSLWRCNLNFDSTYSSEARVTGALTRRRGTSERQYCTVLRATELALMLSHHSPYSHVRQRQTPTRQTPTPRVDNSPFGDTVELCQFTLALLPPSPPPPTRPRQHQSQRRKSSTLLGLFSSSAFFSSYLSGHLITYKSSEYEQFMKLSYLLLRAWSLGSLCA